VSAVSFDPDEHSGHGVRCDCRNCTLNIISNVVTDDEDWLRANQSAVMAPYDFKVASAHAAMCRRQVFFPTEFDPSRFRNLGRAEGATGVTATELFPETALKFTKFPGFTPNRFMLACDRPIGPRCHIQLPLVFTDGSCSNNGTEGATAGCGVAICEPGRNPKGCLGVPLEAEGPWGERFKPTSNRAELRAVIAALEWKYLYREGWEGIVIATDSTYVKDGATKWVEKWLDNDWCKTDGSKAANRDLWKYLLRLFKLYGMHGCEVMIWHIPREQNQLADRFAKFAATGFSGQRVKWTSHREPHLKQDVDSYNF
jgi:ribonuclease HI